ncbi:hypothetical protein ACE1SV_71680 [Streptomyces sennicomposti]
MTGGDGVDGLAHVRLLGAEDGAREAGSVTRVRLGQERAPRRGYVRGGGTAVDGYEEARRDRTRRERGLAAEAFGAVRRFAAVGKTARGPEGEGSVRGGTTRGGDTRVVDVAAGHEHGHGLR